jgi:hypothetical protein
VEVPFDSWDVDKWRDLATNTCGKMYVREGGFIRNADRFDAAFFDISPAEAKVTPASIFTPITIFTPCPCLRHVSIFSLSLSSALPHGGGASGKRSLKCAL